MAKIDCLLTFWTPSAMIDSAISVIYHPCPPAEGIRNVITRPVQFFLLGRSLAPQPIRIISHPVPIPPSHHPRQINAPQDAHTNGPKRASYFLGTYAAQLGQSVRLSLAWTSCLQQDRISGGNNRKLAGRGLASGCRTCQELVFRTFRTLFSLLQDLIESNRCSLEGFVLGSRRHLQAQEKDIFQLVVRCRL